MPETSAAETSAPQTSAPQTSEPMDHPDTAAVSSPLVFVGAPASGKSTIGRLLAELRGWRFVDVDEQIEQHTGRTIADIFATDGEPVFRQIEQDLTLAHLRADTTSEPVVLSLGGGAVLSDQTRQALHQRPVVWLEVAADHAARRAGAGRTHPGHAGTDHAGTGGPTGIRRPLLDTDDVEATMAELVAVRTPLYREVADFSVDTSTRSADEIVALISMWLDSEHPMRPGAMTP